MTLKAWNVSRVVLAVPALLLFGTRLPAQGLGGWSEPDGGWDYVYLANDGEEVDGEFDPSLGGSLDGTWSHNNGSDAWDGSGAGDQFRPDGVTPAAPGGAGIEALPGLGEDGGDAFTLSIVDTGDPRPRGFGDPSNRKVWLCHDVSQDLVDGSFSLRDGFTMIVRSRNHPDIDPDTAGWQLPDGGVDNDAGQGAAPGYTLRDGGKGGHGFYDADLDRNFSFTPHGTSGYQFPPQVGEGLRPVNFLDLGDNTAFHAFWILVSDEDADDRFEIRVYLDGATEPAAIFENVVLGDDTDCDGMSHLHLGFHSTPQVGGFQVDYFGYKIGLHEPASACPGGFKASFSADTGAVSLTWSPVATVESYTIRRNGAVLREGIPAGEGAFTDADPARPQSTYELRAIAGGAPVAVCTPPTAAVRTVVCPELTAAADRTAGKVNLSWTPPRFLKAVGYSVIRDGALLEQVPAAATSYADAPPAGEHTYELAVASDPADACPVNPSTFVRLFGQGAVEVAGDGWDRVIAGGAASIVAASDGAKSLYFPAVPKGPADSALFAVEVSDLGAGEIGLDRFRVEIQARFENEVRISNRTLDPPSYVHFDLSRTGVSNANDDAGSSESVGQVPNPGNDPSLPMSSSTLVQTTTVGLTLVQGLNVIEIHAVDGAGTPHDDNVQLFAARIGAFAPGLRAALAVLPCAAGLSCSRREDGSIVLSWSSAEPHAYEIERDGQMIAAIPAGNTTTFTDPGLDPGFYTYVLRTTDSAICPALSCTAGGGAPDADGFIREWLILGPLDWGCTQACDNPGADAIQQDYLDGTSAGKPVGELSIEPVEGTEVVLGPQARVRAAARAELNPGRPGTAAWFRYQSPQSLVDYNVVFGGDPGNNYMVYAAAYVVNNTGGELAADLGVTSDDSVQVLLDGREIHLNSVARGVGVPGSVAFDVVPGITLPEGTSRLLVKVFEGGGGTGFALRFEEPGLGVPITRGLEVRLAPATVDLQPRFRRGDTDASGRIDITDAVKLLGFLFLGQPKPECLDAGDFDDDGIADISDAVASLGFQFLGGRLPADPGPVNCGPDRNLEAADLGCDRSC